MKNDDDIKRLFQQFDTTNNGQIDLNEFLKQLRPPINERRQKAVVNLFDSMDVNKDGKLTIVDLKVLRFSRPLFKDNYSLSYQTKYAAQLKDKKKSKSDQSINQVIDRFVH